jgi:3-deoxy-7-phosphoheptulonate synthase
MIIILKPHSPEEKIAELEKLVRGMGGVTVERSVGQDYTVLHVLGDTSAISEAPIEANEIVLKVLRVQEPYKRANRMFHPEDTVVKCCGQEIGGDVLTVIAGPCAVESEEQVVSVAKSVKEAGAHFLRGGAFKPRSSPYSFQGLGREGIGILKVARQETGLGIVSEMLDLNELELFVNDVDIIQVGARNMQNFTLLKELGRVNKPVLLKRGLAATMEEWLMSAEYIMSGGNENVILCERGIRTFEKYTRNTLDISAVPMIRHLSHLPVFVDPSHAAGIWWMVEPLAKCAVAAGANGLIIEVHPDPDHAMSDGAQSLKPKTFSKLMGEIEVLARTEGKSLTPRNRGVQPQWR